MGKRILIPGLIALLLAAGVSAWLVLNPLGHGKGGGASASEIGTPILGVSGGSPDSTAKAHGQDGHATSAQPGSNPGSTGSSAGTDGGKTAQPSGPNPQPPQSDSTAGSTTKPIDTPPVMPAPGGPNPVSHQPTRIIDTPRPPNQTLGNARPVSRVIKTPVAKKLEDVSERLKQDRRGLYAQYYAFQSEPLAELAKPEAKTLAQRDANLVRIDNQVHFPNNEAFAELPFSLANFAATWDGYLVIPEQGEYWLFLGADNAARVDLDGETVLLNDVQSRYIEVSTVLELAPGLHPLHIEFAQGMLANEDSWRCAASFMWVPKGQQKPVPVPPEMLMVPQWMWSDDAPIITKLSKYEGEIGDEITIEGAGFIADADVNSGELPWIDSDFTTGVYFNGQRAGIYGLARGGAAGLQILRVKVPIGASTGKVNVIRQTPVPKDLPTSLPPIESVPSNSVEFKVTTQFGLMAQWFESEAPTLQSLRDNSMSPTSTTIEDALDFDDHLSWGTPFEKHNACRFEGRFGIPAAEKPADTRDASEVTRYLRVWINGCARVRFGNLEKLIEPGPTGSQGWIEFPLSWGGERFESLVVEFVKVGGVQNQLKAFLSVRAFYVGRLGASGGDYWTDIMVTPYLLFPPVTPPKPPRIVSVRAMVAADEVQQAPPFPKSVDRPSVREGQRMVITLDAPPYHSPDSIQEDGGGYQFFVDGIHITDVEEPTDGPGQELGAYSRVVKLPPGCGEGKLTAKLGLSTSEPFYIDVANKGLIAYLYDLPNPSGYSQFPNILPLTCHTIRKEREINFGTADSFNLPFVAETFAVEWYGAIIIEQDGWYTFTSRTDDGCRVWLNGIEIIDDDNLHAPQEKSSERIRLVAGTYPLRMQFFENNQHEECLLFVAAVDLQEKELLARQVVPKRMFTWEVHDTLPDKIATGKKADGSE